MEAKFTSLYSGSDKNCLVLAYGGTNLLIDCGGSMKAIRERLTSLDMGLEDISALLITHDHIDHINALKTLVKNTDMKIYSSYGTHKAIYKSGIDMNPHRRIIAEANTVFDIGDIGVEPFATPHDAAEPFGYNFYCGEKTASVATDLGHIPQNFEHTVKGRDFLFLESNHDITLLNQTNRPYSLKKRILGEKGHLCNQSSADFASGLALKGLKRLMLGHLSGDANNPPLAYRTAAETLERRGIKVREDILLGVAMRGTLSETVCF